MCIWSHEEFEDCTCILVRRTFDCNQARQGIRCRVPKETGNYHPDIACPRCNHQMGNVALAERQRDYFTKDASIVSYDIGVVPVFNLIDHRLGGNVKKNVMDVRIARDVEGYVDNNGVYFDKRGRAQQLYRDPPGTWPEPPLKLAWEPQLMFGIPWELKGPKK